MSFAATFAPPISQRVFPNILSNPVDPGFEANNGEGNTHDHLGVTTTNAAMMARRRS